MKLIVAGSRDFNDFQLLRNKLDFFLSKTDEKVEIVSGTCRGSDRLGERYAGLRKLKVKKFPANWNKYGLSAGYKRNEQMAKYASHCVVFWDGKSRGTKHMIDFAEKYKLNLRVVKF